MCDHVYPQMGGVFSSGGRRTLLAAPFSLDRRRTLLRVAAFFSPVDGVLFSVGGVLFYAWPRFSSGGRRTLPRMAIPRAAQKNASPYPEQRNAPPCRPPEKRRLTSKTGSHTTIHHTVVNGGLYIWGVEVGRGAWRSAVTAAVVVEEEEEVLGEEDAAEVLAEVVVEVVGEEEEHDAGEEEKEDAGEVVGEEEEEEEKENVGKVLAERRRRCRGGSRRGGCEGGEETQRVRPGCTVGGGWPCEKKTTSILVASIRSGRARYCSQMCSFMKSLDLVVLFTSSVVPVFPQGGSQAVCQSDRRRGQRPTAPQLPSR